MHAKADIEPELVARVIGKKHTLGRLRRHHPDVVDVEEGLQFRSDFRVGAVADNGRAGIDEVGLTLGLAAPEIRHQAIALLKIHRCAGEIEALVDVVAKRSTDEKWPIENGVEPSRQAILWIVVATGVKEGELVPQPVFIDREFERRHLRENSHSLSRDAVKAVFAEDLIEGVRNIEEADVAVARPAEVIRLHIVIAHRTDGRRPNDQSILVVMASGMIKVGMEAYLSGVTFGEEVLPINVGDQDHLLA